VTSGAYVLARVAVMVRVPARWLWWLGLIAAGIGLFVPSLTGRRIGLLGGAGLFIIAAAVAYWTRRGRYAKLAGGATRAAKSAVLQNRRVTARTWTRAHRWWLLVAFVAALGSAAAAPAAGGLLLAGAGTGLWAKAQWLGRWERRHDALLWVRPERAGRGPAARDVPVYHSTGSAAGDARPGGARRPAPVRA